MSPEPDEYLIERIREALAHDPEIGELDVNVAIRGDRVFLSGTVATQERRDRITELARGIAGDREVCNETVVSKLDGITETERLT